MATKRRQGRYHGVRGQADDAARLQRPLGRDALVRRRQPPRRRHARLERLPKPKSTTPKRQLDFGTNLPTRLRFDACLIDSRVVRDGPVVQAPRAAVFPGHAAAHVAALVWLVVVGRLVLSAVEHVPCQTIPQTCQNIAGCDKIWPNFPNPNQFRSIEGQLRVKLGSS